MIVEWIRFFVTAALLALGLVCFSAAVLGVWRFGFVMNRMHASGIGDSMGLLCIVLAMVTATGLDIDSVKLLLLVVFLWATSPVSAHFLIQIEYFTNPRLYDMADRNVTDDDRKEGKEWNS